MSALPEPLPRPRVGFLGTGWIGRKRLEGAVASGLAEVAFLADPDPAALASAHAAAPAAPCGTSVAEALEAGLDALVIATPSAQHAAQAIAALDAGLAVFCQKPLGRSARETEAVVAAAERNDRLLGVDLSYRHLEGAAALHRLVRTGALGRVRAIDLVFHNAYGPDKAWYADRALAGGGCVLDLGIHLVDLALHLLDFPEVFRVRANALSGDLPLRAAPHGVEDYATATLELAGGVPVSLACSWRLAAGRDCRIEAAVYGSAGGARLANVNGSFYEFETERFRGTAREALVHEGGAWQDRALSRFLSRLGASRSFDPLARQYVEVARALDAILADAAEGDGAR